MRKLLIALSALPGLALAAPTYAPFHPEGGIAENTTINAGSSSLSGKTAEQWGAAIDANTTTSTAAVPKTWIGANTTSSVTGVAPLDDGGRVSVPTNNVGSATAVVCPTGNCPSPGSWTVNNSEGVSQYDKTRGESLNIESWYVNTGTGNGQKPAHYIGAVQGPEGGSIWALNPLVVRNGVPDPDAWSATAYPGKIGSSKPGEYAAVAAGTSTINTEFDYTNWDKDTYSDGDTSFTVDLYVHSQSRFAGWAGIYFDNQSLDNYSSNAVTGTSYSSGILTLTTSSAHGISEGDYVHLSGFSPSSLDGWYFAKSGTTGSTLNISVSSDPGTITDGSIDEYHNFGWHNGVWLNGADVAKDNAFLENTEASYGYQANGEHSNADFYANGSSPYGMTTANTHSVASFYAPDTSPVAFKSSGGHSTADFIADALTSTTPYGFIATGTHLTSDFASLNTSPIAFLSSGTRTSAAFSDESSAPVSFSSTGTKTDYVYNDSSSAPIGLNLGGTYSKYALNTSSATTPIAMSIGQTQSICFAGSNDCAGYSSTNNAVEFQSNVVTGGNHTFLGSTQGSGGGPTSTSDFTQGWSLGWNQATGSGGETDFINSPGEVAGGFAWFNTNVSEWASGTRTSIMSLGSGGLLQTSGGIKLVNMTKAQILNYLVPSEGVKLYDSDDHEEVTYRCPTTSTCAWYPTTYGAALSE